MVHFLVIRVSCLSSEIGERSRVEGRDGHCCLLSVRVVARRLPSLVLRPTNEAPTHSTRRRRRKFGHALNDSEDSSVIRPRASPSSVRLVRKQIFSFFPRETFTCLRCVIKRSALSRRGPSSSPCALPYACSLPRGTAGGVTLAEARVYLLRS